MRRWNRCETLPSIEKPSRQKMSAMPRQATGQPNGRPKGRKSAKVIERERKVAEVKAVVFGALTKVEISLLTPRDIFRMVAHAAVELGDLAFMLKAASDWAPYEHPKLTSTTLDATVRRTAADFTDDELLALARGGIGGEGDSEETARPN